MISSECPTQPADFVSGTRYRETDCRLSPVFEPLRVAATGREAMLGMLGGIVSAGLNADKGSNASLAGNLPCELEARSVQTKRSEQRHSLQSLIIERLGRSVHEGELPEDTNVDVLSCLCTSFASGLSVSVQDGISAASLESSIALFVEKLGFHRVRETKRRSARNQSAMRPGLRLVKR
jgi:hypothetical protein